MRRRVALGVGAGAIALGCVLSLPDTNYDPSILRWARRCIRTGTKMTVIAADYKIMFWQYKDDTPEAQQLALSACHLRGAERLLELFQSNKGLYIKIGQYMAQMNHFLPKEYISTLKVLHSHAPTVPYAEVEQVIREDLGNAPDVLFKSFNKRPLAAASLAQVHHAVRHDGQEVAVKVQHRTLRGDFWIDMMCYYVVLRAAAYFFPRFDLLWTHEEVETGIMKELDFICEGQHAERAGRNCAGSRDVHVPHIHWDMTSHRVLVMEFIHGVHITDRVGLGKMGIDPAGPLRTTITALSEQILLHGFVHCDPHPGNVLVRAVPRSVSPSGWQVVLLDHGLYRELRPSVRVNYCKFWRAIIMRDDVEAKRCAELLGVGQHWKLFAIAVLMRPYKGFGMGFRDGKRLTNRQEFKTEFDKYIDHVMTMLREMPRELLLVFRNQTYLRALNLEMGNLVNRFRLTARVAVQGLRALEGEEAHGRVSGVGVTLRRVWDTVQFEAYLLFSDWFTKAMRALFLLWRPADMPTEFDQNVVDLDIHEITPPDVM